MTIGEILKGVESLTKLLEEGIPNWPS